MSVSEGRAAAAAGAERARAAAAPQLPARAAGPVNVQLDRSPAASFTFPPTTGGNAQRVAKSVASCASTGE